MGKAKKFFMYLILTVASILSVFPLYYMFCASTNRSIDVIAGKLIPGTYLIDNFKALIAQQNLRLALCNSFRNATVLTILCLLVCSIAGYGFEIYHDKAKDAVFTVLLTAMMIPFAAIMIPMFRMFSQLKMVNTMAAFMLPSISTPFMIMMFRQASRSFPHASTLNLFQRHWLKPQRSTVPTHGRPSGVYTCPVQNRHIFPLPLSLSATTGTTTCGRRLSYRTMNPSPCRCW